MKMGVKILGTKAEDVDAARTESSSMRFFRRQVSQEQQVYSIYS